MNDKILSITKKGNTMEETTAFDKNNSGRSMDYVTYCIILGCLIKAEDAMKAMLYDRDNDGRAGDAKNYINDAQETLFDWYEYGKEVSLED